MTAGVGLKLSECCDGYMGCQITTRLALIAVGVDFDHHGGCIGNGVG